MCAKNMLVIEKPLCKTYVCENNGYYGKIKSKSI